MADIRNPVGSQSLVPQARPTGRSEAVRAAQKAFFEAALSGTAAATPASRPAATVSAPAPQVTRLDPAAPPTRILRPGSLVDIKV